MSPWGSDCIFILIEPLAVELMIEDASRAVSEDPAIDWQFPAIVRTGWIFTAHDATAYEQDVTWTSTTGYSDVPAYSGVL